MYLGSDSFLVVQSFILTSLDNSQVAGTVGPIHVGYDAVCCLLQGLAVHPRNNEAQQ